MKEINNIKKDNIIKIDKTVLNENNISSEKITSSIYKIKDEITTEQELLDKIEKKLKTKSDIIYQEINKYKFRGFLFSHKTTPDWINLIVNLLPDDSKKYKETKNHEKSKKIDKSNSPKIKKLKLKNHYLSYILVKSILSIDAKKTVEEHKISPLKWNMYIVTGGYGYNIISEFIEKNFGLNLVPKLINKDDKVIKKVVEDRLMGNRIYTARRNKSDTNLTFETDFANVYRELEFNINEDLLLKLGIINTQDKKINKTAISKDSFKITKQLNIAELNILIERIDEIRKDKMKFALNYFTPATDKNYKNEDLKKLFIKYITEYLKKNDEEICDKFNFEIVGQDIGNYHLNSKFEIQSNRININPIDEPITYEYLINKIQEENMKTSNAFIEDLFYKGKLITYNENNYETQNTELINCLDGYLKNKTQDIFYLRNGIWYIINESYTEIIKEEYKKLYDYSMNYVSENIINKYNELKEKWDNYTDEGGEINPTESKYNKQFNSEERVIYADKILVNNVEIADLIIQEDHKLYLFCLKQKFNGGGCRDLYGQIKTSYQIIQTKLRYNIEDSLLEYYKKLTEEDRGNNIDWKNFKWNFENSKIYYIAGFMENLKDNTTSNYAKLLSLDINKELKDNNFEFILMDFNFNNYKQINNRYIIS